MFRQWLFLAMMAVPAFVTGGGQGVAAEPSDLPPVDPPGVWRALTQDDSTTDSKCLGNPVTPLCAVETVMACRYRGIDELCRIGMGLSRPTGYGRKAWTLGNIERYRIVETATVGKSNKIQQAFIYPHVYLDLDIGDTVILVHTKYCDDEECSGPAPTKYQLRRRGEQWTIIDWNSPRSD